MRRPPAPGSPVSISLDDAGSETLVLRHVPLGGRTVRIGSRGDADEQPVRKVRFEQDWFLGETVVTQGQWLAVLGADHPVSREQSFPGQPNSPVTNVSWEDAHAFCSALQPRVEAGWFARLPTEAEWEVACRAGGRAEFEFGDGAEAAGRAAWTFETSEECPRDVRTAPDPCPPHVWGLVGMHGNVIEWCEDWYWSDVGILGRAVDWDPCHVDESKFTGEPLRTVENLLPLFAREGRADLIRLWQGLIDQHGAAALNEELAGRAGLPVRVLRGGSWNLAAANAASAYRGRGQPDVRFGFIGFRVCLSPRPGEQSRP